MSVWSAECTVLATVCLGQPVINFFVNLGVRRDHAPQVAEVVDNLQFCLFDGNAWWMVHFLWCELMQNFRLLQADFKAKDLSSF